MTKSKTPITATENANIEALTPQEFIQVDPDQSFVDESPDTYPNERLGIPTPPEVADEFKNMPDDWKERNKIPGALTVEEMQANINAKYPDRVTRVDESAGLLPREIPTVKDTVNVSEPLVIPVQPVHLPTDVPLVEASALREPSPHYSVGYPVIFSGEYAAIITKVWENGLVNLIVFSAEHPVSDIKTKVPYGEGFNTWKEIN